MTLFLIGLIGGALFGYLAGKLIVRKTLTASSRTRIRSSGRFAGVAVDDPVSNLMNEMQIGVQLIAENQRNENVREVVRIKADRRKIERDSRARLFN